MLEFVTEGIRTLSPNLAGLPNRALQCLQLSARGRVMLTTNCRRLLTAVLTCLALTSPDAVLFAQTTDQNTKDNAKQVEGKRPKITVRAQPPVGVAPFRVVLTGELQGGADDFEEYYCPTVEWAWGDDTTSESTLDCEPYEAGKSQIKRRFTVEHMFRRAGAYKVYFHLKRKDKVLGSASVTIQVQPGVRGAN
jgi:hypothetical protein